MKRKSRKLSILRIMVSAGLLCSPLFGQVEDAIEQLTGENTKGYLQPFANAFGADLNAGTFSTAHVPKVGLNFQVGLVAMGTVIPDRDLVFMGTPPEPWPQDQVETASVFGGEGTILTDSQTGLTYAFQNGQVQGNFAMLAVPQIEVGSIMGTRLKVRYFAYDFGESIGELKLTGYGLQHSVSQYIPLCPVDLSVLFFKQQFEVGDIISSDAMFYGAQISKGFGTTTLYGGIGMHSATLDVEYTYEAENEEPQEIALELESNSNIWITAGARMKLAILILNGDISIGKRNTFTLGVAFGI
jgi:hypothetical protein